MSDTRFTVPDGNPTAIFDTYTGKGYHLNEAKEAAKLVVILNSHYERVQLVTKHLPTFVKALRLTESDSDLQELHAALKEIVG